MKEFVEKAYDRVEIPPVYKVELLDKLLHLDDAKAKEPVILWRKPSFWASMTAAVTMVVIIYGIWLPTSIQI